jgi:hypothetical protein
MSKPLVVSIPHRLGRDEAIRRLKSGLERAGRDFGHVISIEQQVWNDNSLTFHVRALGQAAAGNLQIFDDIVRLEVTLPWLLAKLTERFLPTIEQKGRLLLDNR